MSEMTFFWHDYETWGVNPRADRPSQFAGIRTNKDLEIIDDEVMIYCRPGTDFIPHPESVMITGLTPQVASERGVCEAEFFQQIHAQLSRPGTCGVGYNSLRFDDEVTRFGFYRNFYDPYAREWKDGNSRWDIIDLVRMAYALRPEGINWPVREDGVQSFRLEDLTVANDIPHVGAHDALADVHATIGLARLIREMQPDLFNYYLKLRNKNEVLKIIKDLKDATPILHVSGMYPIEHGRIAPVLPVAFSTRNKNELIVVDLRQDPDALLSLSAKEIGQNLFTRTQDLPDGVDRVGIKTLHINKCPAVAPVATLRGSEAKRWQIDLTSIRRNRDRLLADKGLTQKIIEVYEDRQPMQAGDVDVSLYGGFIGNSDRKLCNKVLKATPESLVDWTPDFDDARLQQLFPRYRARNWPQLLNEEEQNWWRDFCRVRLFEGDYGSNLTIEEFNQRLQEICSEELDQDKLQLLGELEQWVQGLVGSL
jgi:exodeoxyribonuclease-1